MCVTVITNCTNRKLIAASVRLQAPSSAKSQPEALCADWLERLAQESKVGPVGRLYGGRSFREAEAAARSTEAQLMIVSAGLGLVNAETLAPSYSLTLAGSPTDAVLTRIAGGAADWWRVLQSRSPYSASVTGEGLILAALSRPYLEMVAQDWIAWPAERLARLRLFSKDVSSFLPTSLAAQWMPYDDRLDQVPGGYAGTQSDFAQRALAHFAKTFAFLPGDSSVHARAVTTTMQAYEAKSRPERLRQSDAEIIALIGRDWEMTGGRAGATLIHLRSNLGVACEQTRFKDLFKRALAARGGVVA